MSTPPRNPNSSLPRRRLSAVLGVWGVVLLVSTGCQLAADGYNAQGLRDYQQGNYHGALERFRQAAQSDPRNADAYYNMAATHHRQGIQTGNRELLNQAELLYNQCLDLDKDHVDAYRGLAVLLNETDRPDKAFKLMRNWTVTSPMVADARIELARLYEEFGDLKSAKIHLQEALTLDQNHPRAWMAMAHVREREKDYAQALANYQRAYSLQGTPQLAERIAQLTSVVQGTAGGAGTRTVTAPQTGSGWNARY